MVRFRGRTLVAVATAGVALLALGAGQSFAGQPSFTETYNVPQQACEGLNLNGVVYSFTIAGTPSSDCQAGTVTGPGTTNNISAPNIEGNAAGVLTLTLDHPATTVGFGYALDTFTPQPNGVTVDLFGPGASGLRRVVSLNATNDPSFVGGRFNYAGPAVSRFSVEFAGAGALFPRFAIDNLTYFRPPGQS
jgi:hypothetical protein